MSARAGIVVTGTEVLTGRVQDRNGPWLSDRLLELGADTAAIIVVGDRPDEILRARFRNSFQEAQPVPSGESLHYAIDLHTNAHAFKRGHRIMVQVQSTWFPLYDRNPQKFVPNVYEAHASDYVKATQRIYRGGSLASTITLPVVK